MALHLPAFLAANPIFDLALPVARDGQEEGEGLLISDVEALHSLLLCDAIGDCASDEKMDDLVLQEGEGQRGGLLSMLGCMG